MDRAALLESWAVTVRHLAAARFNLPEVLPSEEAESVERSYVSFLHHNELELAMREAEQLGELCAAPAEFWRELRLAARNMGLQEDERGYAARQES